MQLQTFLPHGPDFEATARSLDRQRLLKQRVETLQIINALAGRSAGWRNHPATRQWSGYEGTLMKYQEAVCAEVVKRGYRDTCLMKTRDVLGDFSDALGSKPPFLDDRRLMITHRASLYRKLPEHYPQFKHEDQIYRDYVCCARCSYWWPTHQPPLNPAMHLSLIHI